jgi:hypothetical protein
MTSLAEPAGRRIVVPPGEAGRYRRLAGMARNLEGIPDGCCISFGHSRESDSFMVTLTLEPLPDWQTRVLSPSYAPREVPDPVSLSG